MSCWNPIPTTRQSGCVIAWPTRPPHDTNGEKTWATVLAMTGDRICNAQVVRDRNIFWNQSTCTQEATFEKTSSTIPQHRDSVKRGKKIFPRPWLVVKCCGPNSMSLTKDKGRDWVTASIVLRSAVAGPCTADTMTPDHCSTQLQPIDRAAQTSQIYIKTSVPAAILADIQSQRVKQGA